MEDIHNVHEKSIRKPPTFGNSVGQMGYSEFDGNDEVDRQTPTTPLTRA